MLAGAWESWVVKALPVTVVMIFLGVGATDGLIAPTYENIKIHMVAANLFHTKYFLKTIRMILHQYYLNYQQ